MTRTIASICRFLLSVAGCVALLLLVGMPLAYAGNGATVVAGKATITSPNGTTTLINQTSKKVIINWQSLSIPAGSSMIFDQPNSKSIALNRVTGDSISNIFGSLLANGQVWIINPNGVLFGKGSQVNVAALIATTSDISNQDFLNGKYNFNGTSTNPNASVVNQGSIHASDGGTVVLAGPSVSNQGLVQADLGSVVLAGATTYSLDFNGDNLIRFAVSTPTNSDGQPQQSLVANAGKIVAQGGQVLLTARAAKDVVDDVVNNSGVIEATGVSDQSGEIVLDAGSGGTVDDSGTLDASGKGSGQTGGSVTVTGNTINVADGAKIDVSGDSGGGTVNIGGSAHGAGPLPNAQTTTVGQATIDADATSKGNGGNVIVWSDGTTNFNGSISARGGAQGGNGGFVETSGHYLGVGSAASVDTLAANGTTGNWLLDPDFINIVTGGGGTVGCATSSCDIAPGTIITALNTTAVTLQATTEIDVENALTYNSANTLSLLSGGNIYVDADIQNAGSGAINLVAGWDGHTTAPASFGITGVFGNNGGSVFIGQGNDPAVGSAGGATSVYSSDLTIDGSSGGAQLGYHGTGGGNIFVDLTGDLTLIGGSSLSDYAHIGNGDFTGNNLAGSGSNNSIGSVTGNISLLVDGILYTLGGNDSTLENTWIGNVAGAGHIESGNVTIIMQDNHDNCESDCGNFFGDMIEADLGATSNGGSGGDFTIAFTSPTGDSQNNNSGPAFKLNHGFTYDSPHALTAIADVSFEVSDSIQNQGTGALTMIAGWSPAAAGVTPLEIINTVNTSGGAALANLFVTTPGAYGNNNSRILIGGDNAGCDENDCIGDTAFGSKGGTTTVAAADVYVVAQNGYAVIGYVGSGATGDINVYANGSYSTPVGGIASCLNNSGDVCVASGNTAGYFAQIGDVGTGSSSNINVHATGDVIMAGSGLSCCDQNDNPNGIGSTAGVYAQIGNTDTTGSGADTVSGKISVVAAGVLDLETNTDTSSIWIGNRSVSGTGKESGDVTIIAKSEEDNGNFDLGNVIAADLGSTAIAGSGGNVTLGLTAPNDHNSGVMDIDHGAAFDSPNDLTVLSGAGIIVGGSLENAGAGDVTLVAGWNPNIVTPDQITTATNGAGGSAIVNLLTGAANSFGHDASSITIGGNTATGDAAVGSADGTTTVLSDNLTLAAANGYAQLGFNGDASGDINVQLLGNLTMTGGGNATGLFAQIGSGGLGSIGSNSGSITINANGTIALTGGQGVDGYVQIGNGGALSNAHAATNFSETGDIEITGTSVLLTAGAGAGSYVQIGNGGLQSGSNMGAVNALNDGTINVTATAGPVTLNGGSNADAYVQIGNGGDQANAGAAAGATATNSGDVTVTSLGATAAVTLTAGTGADSYTQIGNGGFGSFANDLGNITVTDLELTGGAGANAYAEIGNGDASLHNTGDQDGVIDVNGGTGTITLTNGVGQTSPALIGCATGHGVITCTIVGFTPPPTVGGDASTVGILASLQNPDFSGLTSSTSTTEEGNVIPPNTKGTTGTTTTGPIAEMTGNSGQESSTSDSTASSIGQSLDPNSKPGVQTTTISLLGGLLHQNTMDANAKTPHGVPPADQDYSSWGNEAFWQ